MELEELIAKCEAAMGPDRELDAWIYWAQFGKTSRPIGVAGSLTPFSDFYKRNESNGMPPFDMSVPRYTSSLDAALTLAPEGMDYEVRSYKRSAAVGTAIPSCDGVVDNPRYRAATPAIALCIAALKAKSHPHKAGGQE